jgi:hypothetical protein
MTIVEGENNDPISQGDLVRCGLRYFGWYFLAWFVLAVVFYFFPQWSFSGASIAMVLTAAGMTYSRFLKDKRRLPSRPEYWSLVLLSTFLSIIMELLIALFIIAQGGMPGFGVGLWIGVVAITGIRGLFMHMIYYSKFVGTSLLKRSEKKQKVRA